VDDGSNGGGGGGGGWWLVVEVTAVAMVIGFDAVGVLVARPAVVVVMQVCSYLCTVRLVNRHGAHHARALHLNALAVDDLKGCHAVFKHDRCLLATVKGDGVDLALDLDDRVDALEDVQRLVHPLGGDDDRLVANLTE
jgi:hypothetical protein